MRKKCLVLFSGGLDSRLVAKIMQEQNFKVIALFFNLPFINENLEDIRNFCKKNNIKLKIADCTKGKLLEEYIQVINSPKYGRGSGFNPCIDCKIFIFEKARIFADAKNIEIIATGDVLGERPFSQNKSSLELIEKQANVEKRILRPLCSKILKPTFFEKKGLVNREDMFEIQGRGRSKQIELAKKYNISYPNPSGGCLLCETRFKKRFKTLLKRDINCYKLKLIKIGRHFLINNSWIVLGRDKKENFIIEKIGKRKNLVISSKPGPTALIIDNYSEKSKKIAEQLVEIYSKKENLEQRKKFEKFKL